METCSKLFPKSFIILALIPLIGAGQTYSQEVFELPPLNPVLEVAYLEDIPEIDGRVDFDEASSWTPLPDINWQDKKVEICSWFNLGWNEEGLYFAALVPRADQQVLMPAGRTPEAPFILDMELDAQSNPDPAGIGKYTLRFIPIVEDVSRMIYRSQPFLMNHRFGAGTDWHDEGLVVWTERTITGIRTEGIMARWTETEGLSLEVFIPWENLRTDGLPGSHPVYFNLSLLEPGRSNSWIHGLPLKRESGAELVLLKSGEPSGKGDFLPASPLVYLPSSLHRLPEDLLVAVNPPRLNPADPDALIQFFLKDASGKVQVSKTIERDAGNELVFAAIPTGGLKDGIYNLEVRSGPSESLSGSRPVYLAGNIISDKYMPCHTWLTSRLDQISKQDNQAWISGHLARTKFLLDEADPVRIRNLENLNSSVELLAEANTVLGSLENGDRPRTGREHHSDIGGFVADGKRGYIHFIPVEGTHASLKILAGSKLGWEVSPLIYGTFSEPVVYDRPIYGQLYAQLLRNPSFEWGHPTFEETVSAYSKRYKQLDEASVREIAEGAWLPVSSMDEEKVAAPWIGVGYGDVDYSLEDAAFNTRACQEVTIGQKNEMAGIAQAISLPAWRCGTYTFEVYLKSPERDREVTVQLFNDGKMIDKAVFAGIDTSWNAYHSEFNVPLKNKQQNTFLLAITSNDPGSFSIDLATLYPADTLSGFDPQVLDQFRELNTGWTRWPGGNFASIYDWRDGIGPVIKRPALPNPTWPGLSSNAMGTDEYLVFSELTGQEPLICVNAGTGSPEDAASWVEYCNGPDTSEMGRLRFQNGHREPYGVKYWNIGNELWGNWQWGHCEAGEYADRYLAFSRAMKSRDPGIRILAVATGAHTQGHPRWTTTLLDRVGKELDILDFHTYVTVPAVNEGYNEEQSIRMMIAIPVAYEQSLMEFRQECLKRSLSHIQVDIGEYNNNNIPGLSDEKQVMTDLLTYAGWLHGFIRQGEYVMGSNATEYSVFDPAAGQFGSLHPRFDLFRIYRNKAGSQPIPAILETPVWQSPHHWGKDVDPVFNVPVIDAVVLKTPEDGSLGVGLINRDLLNEITLEIELEDFVPEKSGIQYLFNVGLKEDISKGTKSQLIRSGIKVDKKFRVTLPPHSVSLVKIFPAN